MEELQMVAEAIKSLGDAGQNAFIWWLAKCIFVDITRTICWLSLLAGLFKFFKPYRDKEINGS